MPNRFASSILSNSSTVSRVALEDSSDGNSRVQEWKPSSFTNAQSSFLSLLRCPRLCIQSMFLSPLQGGMSSLLSLPQWKGPVRQKSSTPFFPGAWPGTPSRTHSSDNIAGSDDAGTGNPIDKEQASVQSVLPHLEHVANFHRRISETVVRPSVGRSLSHRSLNVEIPQSPHLTGLSEYTVSVTVGYSCRYINN